MLAATAHLEGAVKQEISVGQATRRTASGTLVGLEPSKPGYPPHVLTGRLRQSIAHAVTFEGQAVVGKVGTNVEYAPFLEFGTRRMEARPFLRPTLFRERKRIAAILKGE